MDKAVIKSLRHLPVLLALAVFSPTIFAHQLDEYLQATLVSIEPTGLRLKIILTPGVEVADRVLALIDRDGDGSISNSEAANYAEQFQRDLSVQLDNHNVELKLLATHFPSPNELRTGWEIIQMEFSIVSGPLGAGVHRLTIENRHLPTISAYLLNAAMPRSVSIRITSQARNENQSAGEIEFTLHSPATSPASLDSPLSRKKCAILLMLI